MVLVKGLYIVFTIVFLRQQTRLLGIYTSIGSVGTPQNSALLSDIHICLYHHLWCNGNIVLSRTSVAGESSVFIGTRLCLTFSIPLLEEVDRFQTTAHLVVGR